MKEKETDLKERIYNKIKEIGNGSRARGITLIALVITIVVLIILAGVIISITLGNGGVIDRAKLAKQEYANAQNYEETQISKMTNEIDSLVSIRGNNNLLSLDTSKCISTIWDEQDFEGKTYSYTALEDSYVVGWIEVECISGSEIYFNNVQIGRNTENSNTWSGSSICYLLRKGDKIEFKNFGSRVEGHIKAYGTK